MRPRICARGTRLRASGRKGAHHGVDEMKRRRLGRLGHHSSVIIYGAAMLDTVDQATADRSVEEALAAGINHFDIAPMYGSAETLLGKRMSQIRDQVFLSTKTAERRADEAYRQICESLRKLQTDYLDLVQLHAVCTISDLDRVTSPDGALAAAVKAREQGLVAAIGITGHGFSAPATHLEALRRFPFETVMTPLNYALAQRPDFYRDFLCLAEEVRSQDAGMMAIKTGALRNWRTTARSHNTWYEPLTKQEHITASVAWNLGHTIVTGLPSPSDTHLLSAYVLAEQQAESWSMQEAASVLAAIPTYSSGFGRPPRSSAL